MYQFKIGNRCRTLWHFNKIEAGAEVIIDDYCRIVDDCYYVHMILPDGKRLVDHIHGEYLVKSKDESEITPEAWFNIKLNKGALNAR